MFFKKHVTGRPLHPIESKRQQHHCNIFKPLTLFEVCTCALGQITLPVPKQDVEHPTHVELEFFPPILYPDLMLREFD